jgi:hypothetical protein
VSVYNMLVTLRLCSSRLPQGPGFASKGQAVISQLIMNLRHGWLVDVDRSLQAEPALQVDSHMGAAVRGHASPRQFSTLQLDQPVKPSSRAASA